MTSERTTGHPSDLELAAWVDEPEMAAADVPAHVEGCARCRERVAGLMATRAAIALDPPMPSSADFDAQRARILEAIEGAPREGGGRIVRRIAWLVPLAAAAMLAIVLMDRADPPAPESAGEEIFAEAEAAAEEAAALAAGEEALDALAATDPSAAPAIERAMAIEGEFALLTEAEQSAVLRELERTDFEL